MMFLKAKKLNAHISIKKHNIQFRFYPLTINVYISSKKTIPSNILFWLSSANVRNTLFTSETRELSLEVIKIPFKV